jgi:hypothetical protein
MNRRAGGVSCRFLALDRDACGNSTPLWLFSILKAEFDICAGHMAFEVFFPKPT